MVHRVVMEIIAIGYMFIIGTGCYFDEGPWDPCQDTSGCMKEGMCTSCEHIPPDFPVYDTCVNCEVGSDADCEGSEICSENGRCMRDTVGSWGCRVSHEGCVNSKDCIQWGGCEPVASAGCGPTKEEHCMQSVECKTHGRCRFVDIYSGCVK